MIVLYIILAILLIIIVYGACHIRIVRESNVYVIERNGKYEKTWEAGIHFLLPLVDRVSAKISIKEKFINVVPQTVITKDNVNMSIDLVIFYLIRDPHLYTYKIENPVTAINFLTSSLLRDIIGDLTLDECLTSRDDINNKVYKFIEKVTAPWGIKISTVEIKKILPPQKIQDAMNLQMIAERERREKILHADGVKQSTIIIAEGEKQATILRAQGEAELLRLISESAPTEETLRIKYYEALAKMADGNATKMFLPINFDKVASIAAVADEVLKSK